MGTKREATVISFIISMVILIIFVAAGIFIKDKILEKMPKEIKEDKKITAGKDEAKATSFAFFGLAGIFGFLLVVIMIIYKVSGLKPRS